MEKEHSVVLRREVLREAAVERNSGSSNAVQHDDERAVRFGAERLVGDLFFPAGEVGELGGLREQAHRDARNRDQQQLP
jgi:hypothetical protein